MGYETRWVANLTLMFTELPLLERPRAAKAAGFNEVEFWWPFGSSGRPGQPEVDEFVDAIATADVKLTAMNLFGGDMPAGERGVLSYTERTGEFRDSVDIAMKIGDRLGTKLFNAPYGHRRTGLDAEEQDRVADANLHFAAAAAEDLGAAVLIEPVSNMAQYPIKTADDAVRIIERVEARTGSRNLGFLLDQYHLGMNGDDPLSAVEKHYPRIAHVQLADIPGRGAPGSGSADIRGLVTSLRDHGYDGPIALEFVPTISTSDSLAAWARELATWE